MCNGMLVCEIKYCLYTTNKPASLLSAHTIYPISVIRVAHDIFQVFASRNGLSSSCYEA